MEKFIFSTVDEARLKLKAFAEKESEKLLDELGFSINDLEKLNVENLQQKRDQLSQMIISGELPSMSRSYSENNDYIVQEDPLLRVSPVVGFTFYLNNYYQERIRFINIKIAEHTQGNLINSIKKIVGDELSDHDLKKKLELSLEEFRVRTKELEDKIIENATPQKIQPSDIEIKRSELEILDKKTEIFLKFIAKESIASMLGAILLILITLFLIINMVFSDKEPTKIVETAFLLILGYFFGQSTTKSNK